jgi:hypothetical protein
MVRLTRLLARTEPSHPLADRLLAGLAPTLEMDGGAITIGYEAAERSTLSVTDPVAERLEELQDVLREGPSLDAFRTGRPVAEDPAGQRRRWPTLSQSLSERHEATLLYAVPMMPESRVLGVVSMYRNAGAPLDFDRDGAQVLADAIGVAMLGHFGSDDLADLVWSTRDRVHQATGMVVARLRIPPADALALLRAHAFAHGVTLADVADDVVSRRLDFRDPESETGPR